jgi:excisionase family DNA binding protein
MAPPAGYLTPEAAAARLGISPQAVRRRCREQRIQGARMIGRSWCIPEVSLDATAIIGNLRDTREGALWMAVKVLDAIREEIADGRMPAEAEEISRACVTVDRALGALHDVWRWDALGARSD